MNLKANDVGAAISPIYLRACSPNSLLKLSLAAATVVFTGATGTLLAQTAQAAPPKSSAASEALDTRKIDRQLEEAPNQELNPILDPSADAKSVAEQPKSTAAIDHHSEKNQLAASHPPLANSAVENGIENRVEADAVATASLPVSTSDRLLRPQSEYPASPALSNADLASASVQPISMELASQPSSESVPESVPESANSSTTDSTQNSTNRLEINSSSNSTSNSAPAAPAIAQSSHSESSQPSDTTSESTSPRDAARSSRDILGSPSIQLQGVYLFQRDESSARARVTATYPISPNLLFGTTVDLTTGNAFTDSRNSGLDLNELYLAASPSGLPSLRFVVGMMDLTSYFDRNSFAKDGATHFFNPVFQTNPALSATGIGSRPGVLVNWTPIDNLSLTATTFSSNRDLGHFSLDGFAAEVAARMGNLIVRGTYATDRDAGRNDGFNEIYSLPRNNGRDFGVQSHDREVAYGINAEYYIPEIRMGLFGRYGWYNNRTIDRSGETYSLGFNLLDVFMQDDRLGLGYGRELSNDRLRRGDRPDVWELFYDARLTPNLRAGISLQERNDFSETILGFRIRADFNLADLGRLFR